MKRRNFLEKIVSGLGVLLISGKGYAIDESSRKSGKIMSVNGILEPGEMGFTLSHEHLLVDFSGAASYDPEAWDRGEVEKVMEPLLQEIKNLGCRTFVDCTPEFLGRDPALLKILSDISGLNIITNTGLYGAVDNKYLPEYAFRESALDLSKRWIKEFRQGISQTDIRPGFIKIGVNNASLSELHKKLVKAAALTHLKTGLTIASHTGGAVPAFEEINILKENGVDPSAFIWVHSQVENDQENRIKAGRMGAWISLDGVAGDNANKYSGWLRDLNDHGLLKKVLVSQDAGWYTPDKPNGGEIRGYTDVFKFLIPVLEKDGFTKKDIEQIFIQNPARALGIKIRKL